MERGAIGCPTKAAYTLSQLGLFSNDLSTHSPRSIWPQLLRQFNFDSVGG